MENHLLTKMEERDEEAEETLSFCDLPLHENSDQSFLSLQSSSSLLEDTLFEFSFSDLSDHHHSEKNILFFGKSFSTKTDKKPKSRPGPDDWAKRVLGKTGILHRQRTAAPANSRWPLLMVGPAKFPAVVERGRSRRSLAAASGGSERKTKREKRLWGMVKALGCGGGYLAVA